MRYVRDPSQLEAEKQPGDENPPPETSSRPAEKSRPDRKSRTGFNKRLLKDQNGKEQCFEEARATTGSYKLVVGVTSNFNLLYVEKTVDQSSQMEIEDEDGSIDISMAESTTRSFHDSVSSKHPFKLQRIGSKTDDRRLFRPNTSFEAGLDQTAISNASSTINEVDAVGMSTKKEDATINTKLAMRELSMMFSSPAFGMDDRKQTDRSMASRITETAENSGADTSFGVVGDGLMLDNSICNHINTSSHVPPSSGIRSREDLKPGFTIFEDDEGGNGSPSEPELPKSRLEFQIYEDGEDTMNNHKSLKSDANSSYSSSSEDERSTVDASRYETGDTVSISEAMAVLGEDNSRQEPSVAAENDDGDTATLSLFNEIFQDDGRNIGDSKDKVDDNVSSKPFEIFVDGDFEDNQNVR